MRSLIALALLLLAATSEATTMETPGLRLGDSAGTLVVGAAQMNSIPATGSSAAEQKASAMANANKIVNISKTATMNHQAPLDLIVFPEYELYGNLKFADCKKPGGPEAVMAPYCEKVPGTNMAHQFSNLNVDLSSQCSNSTLVADSMMLTIACSMMGTMTTVSYNACESELDALSGKTRYYNSQLVIQNGTLLAKYRKFHVWATECFATPELQLVTFSLLNKPPTMGGSNFTFGLFTCFDILFKDPKEALVAAGVRYFSYSSAIPLVARETVKVFSYANNVSVVASNKDLGSSEVVVDGVVKSACSTHEDGCVAVTTLTA